MIASPIRIDVQIKGINRDRPCLIDSTAVVSRPRYKRATASTTAAFVSGITTSPSKAIRPRVIGRFCMTASL